MTVELLLRIGAGCLVVVFIGLLHWDITRARKRIEKRISDLYGDDTYESYGSIRNSGHSDENSGC